MYVKDQRSIKGARQLGQNPPRCVLLLPPFGGVFGREGVFSWYGVLGESLSKASWRPERGGVGFAHTLLDLGVVFGVSP